MDRLALIERFRRVRAGTEALAAGLTPEDQQLQSMPSASPTKWHRAHTTWFFETFVLGPRGVSAHDPQYAYLFNSYYEALGARHPRPKRGMISRPTAAEIGDYRQQIDARVLELLADASATDLALMVGLVLLGLAHEEQHQELLLTDILHAFAGNPMLPAYRTGGAAGSGPVNVGRGHVGIEDGDGDLRQDYVPFDGGLIEIGHAGEGFAFDNEGPRHRQWLAPFAIAKRLVNVAEVRAFIDAGGYTTPSLWLAEGYDWVRREGIDAPLYVSITDGSYQVFGLDGLREADDAEPVSHLSYYEAEALARFLGGRLPTEIEWEHVAAEAEREGNFCDAADLPGAPLRPRPPQPRRIARPGGGTTPAASPSGDVLPLQLFGDVWEWTASSYEAYPGFSASADAVGEYNGKFMVNQRVLRGGSCFTPAGHVRASYRNFWHPDTRFQVTGLRLCRKSAS